MLLHGFGRKKNRQATSGQLNPYQDEEISQQTAFPHLSGKMNKRYPLKCGLVRSAYIRFIITLIVVVEFTWRFMPVNSFNIGN